MSLTSIRAGWAQLVLVLAILGGGCGNESGDGGSGGEGKRSGSAGRSVGAYPGDPSLTPEEVVRGYVETINERDGRRFCRLVAPYVSGALDLAGRQRDPLDQPRSNCPKLVSGFIGYVEDCCPPKFLRAHIDDVGRPSSRGRLVRVEVRLTLDVEDTATDRRARKPLLDTVWLARLEGAWRVAKLSALAQAASLAFPVPGGPGRDFRSPPDLAAAQRSFDRQLANFERRRRERRASYTATGKPADCSSGLTLSDRRGDIVDYRFPAPKSPIPNIGAVDLRAVAVHSRRDRVCVAYDMACPVNGPIEVTFNVGSNDFGRAATGPRIAQAFEIDLRADGTARVTSGENDQNQPISVPATVGRAGRKLTLVLTPESFKRGKAMSGGRKGPPPQRFAFLAAATAPVGPRRLVHDDLGPQPAPIYYTYPDGRPRERISAPPRKHPPAGSSCRPPKM